MKKRERDTILAGLRQLELSQTDREVAEICGNGYITGKIFEMLKSIQATPDEPATAKYTRNFYENIMQWAVAGIYKANKLEALNVTPD